MFWELMIWSLRLGGSRGKEIVVFEGLKDLVKKFEGVGGVEGLKGSGEGWEAEERDGEWRLVFSLFFAL